MNEIYQTGLYCEASEFLETMMSESSTPRIGCLYCQSQKDGQVTHYFGGLYAGDPIRFISDDHVQDYENEGSGLHYFEDEHDTGYYCVSVVNLGEAGLVDVSVQSLRRVGERFHAIVAAQLGAAGEENNFDVPDMVFADAMVDCMWAAAEAQAND